MKLIYRFSCPFFLKRQFSRTVGSVRSALAAGERQGTHDEVGEGEEVAADQRMGEIE